MNIRTARASGAHPQLLVFATFQPVMFVLLFRYVFGGSIHVPHGSYVDYLIPGVIVQTVVLAATSTSVGMAQGHEPGRHRPVPVPAQGPLRRARRQDHRRPRPERRCRALMVVVGTLVGFRFHNGFLPAVAAVGIALVLGYSLSWTFALVGLTARHPESAQLAGFLPIFPLVFASSVFTSVASMPGWLQAFAKVQPITRAANTVRALTQGGPVQTNLIWTLAWSVAIIAVFAPRAVRRYE